MNTRVLGMAIAAALLPAALPAQLSAPDTAGAVSARHAPLQAGHTVRLTSGFPVLKLELPDARLALPDSAMALDLLPSVALPQRWVRTGKWSLLAAAAGFSAYAMLHSRGDTPDSRAQLGIAGGYLSLLGSAGLFVYDLRNARQHPENIPFQSASSVRSTGEVPTTEAGVSGER